MSPDIKSGIGFWNVAYVKCPWGYGPSITVRYTESAFVRIKWEKASYEHIKNHRLMHYIIYYVI
jgi:hypothetical protein